MQASCVRVRLSCDAGTLLSVTRASRVHVSGGPGRATQQGRSWGVRASTHVKSNCLPFTEQMNMGAAAHCSALVLQLRPSLLRPSLKDESGLSLLPPNHLSCVPEKVVSCQNHCLV